MATDTINPTVDHLATTIQRQCSRILSLEQALDEAIDFPSSGDAINERMNRALDYLGLIREAAQTAKNAAEEIEIIDVRSRNAK